MTWGKQKELGIPSIDEEHRALYDAIEQLNEAALAEAKAREETGRLLRVVLERTRDHCSSEEAELLAAKFPEFAEHRQEHESFIREIEELADRFEKDGLILNEHSLNFLCYWFDDHLQNADRSYAAWLKKRGDR